MYHSTFGHHGHTSIAQEYYEVMYLYFNVQTRGKVISKKKKSRWDDRKFKK